MKWFPDGPSKQHAIRQARVPPARKEAMAATSDPPTLFSSSFLPVLIGCQHNQLNSKVLSHQNRLSFFPDPAQPLSSVTHFPFHGSHQASAACLPCRRPLWTNWDEQNSAFSFCKRKIKEGWGRNSKQSNPHVLRKCTRSFERKWLFTSFLKNKNKQENSPSPSSHFLF